MIFRILLLLFIGYFLVRFILRFVLPVVRMVSATQKQMRNLNDKMDQMKKTESKKKIDGDYIDFEEVK